MNYEEIKKLNFCIHKSYPKVEKNKKDDKLAKKLLEIYAGSKGEITATFQYMYQSFITNSQEKYEELSTILEKISICEMKHIELIAKILISMGIDPKFCKYIDNNFNICNYWSAGNIKYITNIEKFLEYNIKLEEIAIEDYKEALKLTESQNIKDIINLILEDERAHLTVFKKLKHDYIKGLKLRCIDKKENTSLAKDDDSATLFKKNENDSDNPNIINILNVSKTKDNPYQKEKNKQDKNIRIPILDLSILNSNEKNDEITDG